MGRRRAKTVAFNNNNTTTTPHRAALAECTLLLLRRLPRVFWYSFLSSKAHFFFFFEGEKRPRIREIRSTSSRQKTARVSLFSCLRDHQKSNHFRPNRDRDENRHVVLGFSDDWRAKRRRDDETRVHRASSFLPRFSSCPLSLFQFHSAPPRSDDSSVRWN